MSDDDISLSEKRVYGDRRDRTTAFVGSALGLARVELAGDQVGRFSLVHRGATSSVAGADGHLVVGTESDVLVGAGEGFTPTSFGAAAVVSIADGTPVAATPDGDVERLGGDEWEPLGLVTNPGRADGDLLVAADGVFRVGDELEALGGEGVRDVAAAGPYAASARGLLRHDGQRWRREREGEWRLVAADGERACAIGADGLVVRRDGEWQAADPPGDAPLADLAYGERLYAVTADGTLFVRAPPDSTPDGRGGWRSRALGVRGVVGLAVP